MSSNQRNVKKVVVGRRPKSGAVDTDSRAAILQAARAAGLGLIEATALGLERAAVGVGGCGSPQPGPPGAIALKSVWQGSATRRGSETGSGEVRACSNAGSFCAAGMQR